MPFIAGLLSKQKDISPDTQAIFQQLTRNYVQDDLLIATPWSLLSVGKHTEEPQAERAEAISGNKGMLIGRLYTKADYKNAKLDHDYMAVEQNPTKLSADYWGRYIIALMNEEKQTITVFRDPQGGLPLVYYTNDSLTLFSNELSFIYDFLKGALELDWQYLSTFVYGSHMITSSTPFKNVHELAPGAMIKFSRTQEAKPHLYWDPALIKQQKNVSKDNYLETVKKCTKAWIQDSPGTLGLELSGGLDSSSVLMLLHDVAKQPVVGFNFYHSSVLASDEREHAQKVADACNAQLEFVDLKTCPSLSTLPKRRFNKPTSFLIELALSKQIESIAQRHKVSDIVSGQGGDHVFLANPSPELVVDYILAGNIKGLSRKFKEMSALYRKPFLTALKEMVRAFGYYITGKIDIQQNFIEQPWMNPAFYKHVRKDLFTVPFAKNLTKNYPAKAKHIRNVYEASLYIDKGEKVSHFLTINPLLSQPLVELALATPTYELVDECYDRSLYRKFMYQQTKNDYVWRKFKSSTTGSFIFSLDKNFAMATELVLEGAFVKNKLIDPDKVMHHLQGLRHGKSEGLWSIIQLLTAEMWLKLWNLR